MTKDDWKRLGITIVGGVAAAYTIKFLNKRKLL